MQKRGHNIAVIILAAGLSSRMQRLKPLLPLVGKTMIEHHIMAFREAGTSETIVVVGFKKEKIIPVLSGHAVKIIENSQFHTGMYSSIQAGVDALGQDVAAFFLMPCDMVPPARQTLNTLLEAFWKGGKGIIYPCYNKRKGHPPLISTRYRKEILSEKPRGGLRELLGRNQRDEQFVETNQPSILFDCNTPEEYERILQYFQQ